MSRYFLEAGFRLTGLDYSQPMLSIARKRFPKARWVLGDIANLSFGEAFDGILSWHGFFHLDAVAQRSTLPKISAHMVPGAPLMLTVGPQAGEVTGRVGGDTVHHASLSETEYRKRLDKAGLDVEAFVRSDPGCGGAKVLFGIKR